MVVFTKVRSMTDPVRKNQRRGKLNCLLASFLGADADRVFDGTDKNFAVADLPGFGGFDNGLYGRSDLAISQDDFDFYLGQEVDGIFAAPIDFGMAFLPAETLDL